MHLGKYLAGTRAEGIVLKPKKEISFEVYVDTDFAGNWNKMTAAEDESTSKSRTGYIIYFAGCPLIWASKLQTMQALSTTEAEYMALSEALRQVIPMMHFMEELKAKGYGIYSTVPRIFCRAFEDNSGALELERMPRMRPRTKHINQMFHHFQSYVKNGKIKIFAISTKDQLADMFTKPQVQNIFLHLRK